MGYGRVIDFDTEICGVPRIKFLLSWLQTESSGAAQAITEGNHGNNFFGGDFQKCTIKSFSTSWNPPPPHKKKKKKAFEKWWKYVNLYWLTKRYVGRRPPNKKTHGQERAWKPNPHDSSGLSGIRTWVHRDGRQGKYNYINTNLMSY